jgi:hypothetical protein
MGRSEPSRPLALFGVHICMGASPGTVLWYVKGLGLDSPASFSWVLESDEINRSDRSDQSIESINQIDRSVGALSDTLETPSAAGNNTDGGMTERGEWGRCLQLAQEHTRIDTIGRPLSH